MMNYNIEELEKKGFLIFFSPLVSFVSINV